MPLGFVVKIWGRTLRFELSIESRAAIAIVDRPVAFVLWHNRLFVTPEIFRRFRQNRPLYALISASRDGAWLAAFFSVLGMRSVRGSSSRLGREAITSLIDCMRAGNDIGITPDGPRGPCYDFKPGALIVARRANCTTLMVGAKFSSAWQLASWDRFYLPKPFSKVTLFCEAIPSAEVAVAKNSSIEFGQRLTRLNPD